jgi:hypothetical protein
MSLPHNIIDNFQEMHVNLVWEELHDRFGFMLTEWKKKFAAYLARQQRNTHELDAFLKFGIGEINPVLNSILCRQHYHPTFMNLVEYILSRNRAKGKKPNYPTKQVPGTQTA